MFSSIAIWYFVNQNSWAKLHGLSLGLSHLLLRQILGEINGTSAWVNMLNLLRISGPSPASDIPSDSSSKMNHSCLLHCGSGLGKPSSLDRLKIHDVELAGDNCFIKKPLTTSLQFLTTEMTFWLHSILIYAFSVFIKEWKLLGIVWLLNYFSKHQAN